MKYWAYFGIFMAFALAAVLYLRITIREKSGLLVKGALFDSRVYQLVFAKAKEKVTGKTDVWGELLNAFVDVRIGF